MSALRRVVLVLAVALALVLVALAVALPRIAASDRVRARLVAAVEDAARRSFSYRTLDARLVPPRLVLEGARLEGTSERPAAEAGRVELRLALLPLVARTLVVRSLQLEDAALALVRDETGFHLAGSDLPEEPDEPAREPSEPPSRRAGFELAVQRVALERVDVRFDDARPGGAPSLELRDVEGELRARSLDAPVELALRGTAESAGELAVRGGVALRAALEPHAAKGTFELDASDAELAASAWLHKPAGTPATLRGRILRTRDENARSLRLEGVELELGEVEAALEVDVAPVQRIVVDAPALDADALSALVPALRSRELAGTVALERFAVELSPLAVRGLVRLDPLGLGGTGAEHLVLRGALEGAGDELVGRELRAAVGGRETPVELRLAGLASEPRFEVATHAVGIESSALVGALGGKRDALEGPLDLDARLTGRLGGRRAPLATLAGEVRLRVGPGRLRNASLLRAALAGAARAGRAAENEAVLAQASDDRFESLSGRFRIERGVARTDDLRLVYPTSAARLAGSIGLADRSLDLDASAELGREGGAKSPRAIPLASVRGTLDAPEVELTDAALAGAATAYTQDERRRR
ncbi:MAG TPA: AsmA-like C-terminal region-containing protein, partial [Myxococcota bacterium]|nr:AsmA-like C-terminal region-containing protein [Myxococcota bacterium]